MRVIITTQYYAPDRCAWGGALRSCGGRREISTALRWGNLNLSSIIGLLEPAGQRPIVFTRHTPKRLLLQINKLFFMYIPCVYILYYLYQQMYVYNIQGDSFGTRPKKMRLSCRPLSQTCSVAFSSAWTVVANISSISCSLMKQGM
jgi:hypothetical protein